MNFLPTRGSALLAMALTAVVIAGCGPSQKAASVTPSATGQAKSNATVAIARGKIEVEGGLLDISPETGGVVGQLLIKEGQLVEKSQVLLRLKDDAARADLAVAESEWQLAQTRQKSRATRLPSLKQALTRWQAAAKQGAADLQSVDEAARALQEAQAELDIATAEVAVSQRKVEQLRALQKRHELRTPEAATVVRVTTHVGSTLQPGVSVMSLLPNRPFIVRAEVNESFVSAIKEGMHASVVADGDGSNLQLPKATVQRISPIYGAARLQDDTQKGPVRIIECVLVFDQPPANAKVGQNVRVSFHE
ncbi:HlyD family secretion protein [Comamonas sp.]|uniref:HlyD family secretion protein n=1 Tax=Comamonas sp. TaxID=34028 RepID=UPI003A8F1523